MPSRFVPRAPATGFTLLELMMVVAVVAILAAIAIPNYGAFVTRSKIVDGTVKLGDFKTQMDKYFMDNRTYLNGANCGIPNPAVGPNDNFTITCAALAGPPQTFLVTGTGVPAKGMTGFKYTVDQANAKTSVGPGGKYTNGACWALRADGSC